MTSSRDSPPSCTRFAKGHEGLGEILDFHRFFFQRVDRLHHRFDDALYVALVVIEYFVQDTEHDASQYTPLQPDRSA